jgi:hypothetical protein
MVSSIPEDAESTDIFHSEDKNLSVTTTRKKTVTILEPSTGISDDIGLFAHSLD